MVDPGSGRFSVGGEQRHRGVERKTFGAVRPDPAGMGLPRTFPLSTSFSF
jgi:hypothetical protein